MSRRVCRRRRNLNDGHSRSRRRGSHHRSSRCLGCYLGFQRLEEEGELLSQSCVSLISYLTDLSFLSFPSSNSIPSLSSRPSRKPTTSRLLTATPTWIEPILADQDKEHLPVGSLSTRTTLSTRLMAASEERTTEKLVRLLLGRPSSLHRVREQRWEVTQTRTTRGSRWLDRRVVEGGRTRRAGEGREEERAMEKWRWVEGLVDVTKEEEEERARA